MVTGKFCLLFLGDDNLQGHSCENLGSRDLEDLAAPLLAQVKMAVVAQITLRYST